jgi:hypothetical protein
VPTNREWRQYDRDQADRELVDRAADWLFDGHDRRKTAGLQWDRMAYALGDLLDTLSEHLLDLDHAVRWQTIEASRSVVGETMEDPSRRRTRRR